LTELPGVVETPVVKHKNLMNESFRASIVVPLLNQNDSWLRQCVLSALSQTVRTEVVVIVAADTRTSNRLRLEELQAEWSTLVVQPQESGRGFAAAINQGIRRSSSARVGFLLSDDWLTPAAVEKCLRYDTDIVSTGLAAFAADGQVALHSVDVDLKSSEFERCPTLESKADYLSHFFLFRRSKIDEVGGLDETLGDAPGIDDYDFIWSLLEHDATVSIVEERLYCYRDHNQDRLTLRPTSEQMATLSRILAKHGVTGRERKRILRSHRRWFGKPIHAVQAELARMWGLQRT
jgi:glycosyltransferase involved in cell wall biosynthesis